MCLGSHAAAADGDAWSDDGEHRCLGALGGATPVIVTSSRTGRGLPLLAQCLTRLVPPTDWSSRLARPALFTVHGRYGGEVDLRDGREGVCSGVCSTEPWLALSGGALPRDTTGGDGTVYVSGTLLHGRLQTAQSPHEQASPRAAAISPGGGGVGDGERSHYVIGPCKHGRWTRVSILSMRYKELGVSMLDAGQSATLRLRVHDETAKLRSGMVLREVSWEGTPEEVLREVSWEGTPEEEEEEEEVMEVGSSVGTPPTGFHPPPRPSLLSSASGVVWELEAAVRTLTRRGGVHVGSEVVLHCLALKQAARVLSLTKSRSRKSARDDATATDATAGGGGKGVDAGREEEGEEGEPAAVTTRIRLRFVHTAEFVRCRTACVFRDGSAGSEDLCIGAGVVTRLG